MFWNISVHKRFQELALTPPLVVKESRRNTLVQEERYQANVCIVPQLNTGIMAVCVCPAQALPINYKNNSSAVTATTQPSHADRAAAYWLL